jgi:hypothetical protein
MNSFQARRLTDTDDRCRGEFHGGVGILMWTWFRYGAGVGRSRDRAPVSRQCQHRQLSESKQTRNPQLLQEVHSFHS